MECPGCGLQGPAEDGPTHRYMTASPGCWRAFGELLATCYEDEGRLHFRQLVVDAYAAQHPGEGRREQVQSVGIHLMTLCLFEEEGVDPALGSTLHQRMIRRPTFHRLVPDGTSPTNVTHVPLTGPVTTARTRAHEWAQEVWELDREEHATVRAWLEEAGFETRRAPR